MSDRFDLEQQILDCWRMVDDIEIVAERINLGEKELKLLKAVAALSNLKFEKLFNTFEELIKEGKIS